MGYKVTVTFENGFEDEWDNVQSYEVTDRFFHVLENGTEYAYRLDNIESFAATEHEEVTNIQTDEA